MSPTASLSPAQDRVLELITSGFSATAAARQAGVHRNTVANWLQDEAFCAALEKARAAKLVLYRDQAEALAAKAIANLSRLMDDSHASPMVRLKATVAMLDHTRKFLPSDTGLMLPEPPQPAATPEPENEPMHKTAQLEIVPAPAEPENEPEIEPEIEPEPGESPAAAVPPAPYTVPPQLIDAFLRGAERKIGRNEPCPCSSGRKFKHCCLGKTSSDAAPAAAAS